MGTVLFFDTSFGTFNHGDDIIMKSIYREFDFLLRDNYRLNFATHLVNYTHRYCDLAKVRSCDSTEVKFICGTDIIWPNPYSQIRKRQLQISSIVKRPNIYMNSILLGAGIKMTDKMTPTSKSIKLYERILSHDYIHSVRDNTAKQFISSMGFKVVNTGCPTMWMLNEDFCRDISRDKADTCIVSLTSEKKNVELDKRFIEIIQRKYNKIFFWVQRWHDDEYLKSLVDCADFQLIYNLDDYDKILSDFPVDYIGTRLHGGIFALQHKRRSIVIAVDHRAQGMAEENNLPVINRDEIDSLSKKIDSSFETRIWLNSQDIEVFRNQFKQREIT